MQIRVNREAFSRAFQMVAGAASARSSKEVLQNIKLTVNGDMILQATDVETWMLTKPPEDSVTFLTGGSVLLHVGRVGAILKEVTDDEIDIFTDKSEVVLSTNTSRFKLPTADPAEYPSVMDMSSDNYVEFSAVALKAAFEKTSYCTDPASSRFALGGVNLTFEGDVCHVVGTDGRRLAAATIPVAEKVGDKVPSSAILPVKALHLITRHMPWEEGEKVRVAIADNDFVVSFRDTVIRSRLVEGRFPNWELVIPDVSEWPTRIELVPEVISRAVRQAAIVADQETRGVDLEFTEGNLAIKAVSQVAGQSKVNVPIAYEGDKLTVRLDHRFLKDCLHSCGEQATLHLNSSETPALFETDGYKHVIMPMAMDS